MGYRNLRYYIGGMAEWVESGSPVEKLEPETAMLRTRQTVQPPISHKSSWTGFLDLLAGWPLERLVGFWLGMIVVFGVVYWVAGIGIGWGLQAGNVAVKPDLEGLGTAIYFSFVTALSIGYGDVIPLGALRILAVPEGVAGLLIFGCVISKLVSRRQEELTAEIHRTTFEDRLDRVRTNLHLVFSDFGAVQQCRPNRARCRGKCCGGSKARCECFAENCKRFMMFSIARGWFPTRRRWSLCSRIWSSVCRVWQN